MEGNLPFLLCFAFVFKGNFQGQVPGDLYLEGRFNGGFFCVTSLGAFICKGLNMEGLIFGILRYFFYIPEVNLVRGKETLKFSGPYSKIRPAKLTNLSARTN